MNNQRKNIKLLRRLFISKIEIESTDTRVSSTTRSFNNNFLVLAKLLNLKILIHTLKKKATSSILKWLKIRTKFLISILAIRWAVPYWVKRFKRGRYYRGRGWHLRWHRSEINKIMPYLNGDRFHLIRRVIERVHLPGRKRKYGKNMKLHRLQNLSYNYVEYSEWFAWIRNKKTKKRAIRTWVFAKSTLNELKLGYWRKWFSQKIKAYLSQKTDFANKIDVCITNSTGSLATFYTCRYAHDFNWKSITEGFPSKNIMVNFSFLIQNRIEKFKWYFAESNFYHYNRKSKQRPCSWVYNRWANFIQIIWQYNPLYCQLFQQKPLLYQLYTNGSEEYRYYYWSCNIHKFKHWIWRVKNLQKRAKTYLIKKKLKHAYWISRYHYQDIFTKLLDRYSLKFARLPRKKWELKKLKRVRGAVQANGRLRNKLQTRRKYSRRLRLLVLQTINQSKPQRVGLNFLRRELHQPRKSTHKKGLTSVRQFISTIMLKGNRDKATSLFTNYSLKLRQLWIRLYNKLYPYEVLSAYIILGFLTYPQMRTIMPGYKLRYLLEREAEHVELYRIIRYTAGVDLLTTILWKLAPGMHVCKHTKSGVTYLAPAPLRQKRRLYYACKFLQKGGWASGKWRGKLMGSGKYLKRTEGGSHSFSAGLLKETMRLILASRKYKYRKGKSIAEDNLAELYTLALKQKDFLYLLSNIMRRKGN